MARKKTKRSRSTKKKKKQLISEIARSKYFFIMFLCILILSGAIYGLRHFFLNSPYFTVRSIVINNDRGFSLDNEESKLKKIYSGKNIFKVDLRYMKNMIGKDLPQLKKVEARRELPNVLVVDIFSRLPAAVIETSGGIVVDKDGVVLTIGEGKKDLINIVGLKYFLNVPHRGERIDTPSLNKALNLINVIDTRMSSYKDKMEYIDISDKNNLILGVEGVPVKMGIDGFLSKLKILEEMINDPNIKFNDINYIDLRFKDPVIFPK